MQISRCRAAFVSTYKERNEEQRFLSPRFGWLWSKEDIPIYSEGFFALAPKFEEYLPKVLQATSDYWLQKVKPGPERPAILVGIDDTPSSRKYLPQVIKHFNSKGIDVYTYHDPVWKELPQPQSVLAYYIKNFEKLNEKHKRLLGGLMLTTGNNRWETGGIKFLNSNGSLFDIYQLKKINDLTNKPLSIDITEGKNFGSRINFKPKVAVYEVFLKQIVDFTKLAKSKIKIFHDAMHGASKDRFSESLVPAVESIFGFHDRFENLFTVEKMDQGGIISNKSILPIVSSIKSNIEPFKVGLINNTDTTQLRTIDEKGEILSPSEQALCLMHHLAINKRKHGVVIRSWDTSSEIDDVAKYFGLPVEIIPAARHNFRKVINNLIAKREIPLIAVDNEGSISTVFTNPDFDAYTSNFHVLEYLATEKKNLSECLGNIRKQTDRVYFNQRYKLFSCRPDEVLKWFNQLQLSSYKLGSQKIDVNQTRAWAENMKNLYGYIDDIKIFFKNGTWLHLSQDAMNPKRLALTVENSTPKNADVKKIDIDKQELERVVESLKKALCPYLVQEFKVSI